MGPVGGLSEVMSVIDKAGLPQSTPVKDALYQLYLTTISLKPR